MGLNTAETKKLVRNRDFVINLRDHVREQKVLRFLRSRVRFLDDPSEPAEAAAEQNPEANPDNINVKEEK
jgi:hypothetical protein